MRRPSPRWVGPVVGLAALGAVVWRVGLTPFVTGVSHLSPAAVAVALGITAVSTVASAYRWTVVARVMGVDLPLPHAVRAYYRSQLLNSVIPGGVVGDAERGLRHGRDVGARGQALRSVLWERSAGQAVELIVTAAVLLTATSLRGTGTLVVGAPLTAGLAAAAVVTAVAVAAVWWRGATPRALSTVRDDLHLALEAWRLWPQVVVASLLVVAGHVGVFLVAVRTVGMSAPVRTLVPAALVVLAASALPVTVAGWGPREGMAATVFAASGLGGDAGVAASTAYGVLALGAVLPGLVPIVLTRVARSTPTDRWPKVTADG